MLAPDTRFAVSHNPVDAYTEFKTMVRALHAAGLEVILDVVYNHTAEGNHCGPTLSFRASIDNTSYYRLQPGRPSRYEDFTGTGNTLNMQSPHVLQLMMDSLRYWVEDMRVDGFPLRPRVRARARAARGRSAVVVLRRHPAGSRDLARETHRRAVGRRRGRLPGRQLPPGWTEWNGKYRDAVRRFWRGDRGTLPELATRLAGSSDLCSSSRRRPRECEPS